MKDLLRKNLPVVLTFLSAAGLLLVVPAYAGTLSCAVRASSCNGGEVEIFEMQNTSNSHAGMAAASYNNLVCCSGVSQIGSSCSGTYATVLKLSGTTNAHVRQGTLADYPGASNACLSVVSGGTVTVAYQANNCAGFDTTVASMVGTTNSHVGSSGWAAGTTKICATAFAPGALTVDIVDAAGAPVVSPSISMGAATLSLSYQTTSGTFGTASQKIRVDNESGTASWSLTLAAAGVTAFWDGATADYDFNDPTAGAADGGDADSLGGRMTINPSTATITPKPGCNATGLSLGSPAGYSQGVTDNITLITAGSSAGTNCYWDATGIDVSQTVPKEQPVGSYSINMMLTATAS